MSEEKRAPTPIDQMVVVNPNIEDEITSSFRRLAQHLEATAPASMHAVRKYKARRAARAHWPGVNGSITIPERPIRLPVRQNNRKAEIDMSKAACSVVVMIGGSVVVRFYFTM